MFNSENRCFKSPRAVCCPAVHTRRVEFHRDVVILVNSDDAPIAGSKDALHNLAHGLFKARARSVTDLHENKASIMQINEVEKQERMSHKSHPCSHVVGNNMPHKLLAEARARDSYHRVGIVP